MSEKFMHRRIRKLTVIVALISAVILIVGSATAHYLNNMLENAITDQLKSKTQQYKINILRQIDADFQVLHTLASFLEYFDGDTESFSNGFMASKQYNSFEHMGIFDKSADCFIVTIDDDIQKNVPLDSMNEYVIDAIERACQGESCVSKIYNVPGTEKNMFAYAVPVYSGDEIAGAILAAVYTDGVEEVLHDNTVFRGAGHVHMISDTGKILVKSDESVVEEETDSIFEEEYISSEEKEKIRQAMSEGEGCLSEFTYNNASYELLLEPVGVNDWYLFSVRTAQGVSSDIYKLMTNIQLFTGVFLILILIVIAYGYHLIYQGNRRLIKSAYYDSLTGAYNMSKFEAQAAPVIEKTYEYSLAALNVRQFKFINEIFGSKAADNLLRHIKQVINENISQDECFCRSGDDLFYILLKDTNRNIIHARLESIIKEICKREISANGDYQLRLYCGVVIGTDVRDPEPTVKKSMTHVRFALDTARNSAKNNIWFYDTDLHEDEILENYVESHMDQVLENGEFKMYLQPKMNLVTGKVGGAEALVRWIPDDGKTIYPGQFIPIFEKNGFCIKLDMYMVEQACRQIREWIDRGVEPVPLSVNQSKLLFYDADYIKNMEALLNKYQIPAKLITLEILEGLALENTAELSEKLIKLKERGFRVSMDDFGSGYSSLNTLASLKIDELKFDREFLLRLDSGEMDRKRQIIIMNEIIDLTKKLKIDTVVEGVETKENEELIRSFGCDYGQGYYYSKPVSAETFSACYVYTENAE